jgi:hypothetical protein
VRIGPQRSIASPPICAPSSGNEVAAVRIDGVDSDAAEALAVRRIGAAGSPPANRACPFAVDWQDGPAITTTLAPRTGERKHT